MNMNMTNILTKAAGITGVGLIAYDSHTAGKIESSSYQKQVTANDLADSYMDTLSLDTPSVVKSKLKTKVFNLKMDENITEFFTSIAGYGRGVGSMLVENVIPLTLSAGALVKQKFVSKASAIGLVAYGGITFAREILGIGKPKELGHDF